jgi:hypothetical protein
MSKPNPYKMINLHREDIRRIIEAIKYPEHSRFLSDTRGGLLVRLEMAMKEFEMADAFKEGDVEAGKLLFEERGRIHDDNMISKALDRAKKKGRN